MINIRILKICGKSIIKPLVIIYKKCLEKGCFPNAWKKANVVHVHKKKWQTSYLKTIDQYLYCHSAVKFWRGYSITQCLNFSSRITWSLLISPVLRQVTLASTNLFPSLTKYTNHLMMTTKYEVYFLIYQKHLTEYGQSMAPRQNGISAELLTTLTYFLDNRTQRVVLNGQYSS